MSHKPSDFKDGGHSCPPENDWSFLRPREVIDIHENRLPHWQQAGVFYSVTWHLADSLPQTELNRWKEQRDNWLDAGAGYCLLRNMSISKIISQVLLRFNGARYDIDTLVVMPNHVHILFQLAPGISLEQTIKAWKGASARSINQAIGREGTLWTEDYWDTIIRNPEHLQRCRRYIRKNPVKAGLKTGE